MTERTYRMVLGLALLALLYLNADRGVYLYIALLVFEGATNLRVPMLVSRLRYGAQYRQGESPCASARIPFDAERALRFIVALLLMLTFVAFREPAWFFPWFIGSMLLMAGVTNICPMVMALRLAGFR